MTKALGMEAAKRFGDAAVAVALNGKIDARSARERGDFITREPAPPRLRGERPKDNF